MRAFQRTREFVKTFQIARVRHRDVQPFFIALERQKLVAHHQVDRYSLKRSR